ncbi:MAG: acyltransferase family protein, partial [Bacteroidota bacterium]
MNEGKPYFIGLDVLRLFAALFVLFWHLQTHYWLKLPFTFHFNGSLGSMAVSFFFVLSSFLLTYLLFVESKNKNRISISKFYIRRVIRIWPLYFLSLIFAFWIYPFALKITTGYQIVERASAVRYFTFLSNYDVAYFSGPVNRMLGVHWSLAVEEQFYLILPLIFFVFHKYIKYFIFICCLIFSFSLYYKFNVFYYYDTLSVAF